MSGNSENWVLFSWFLFYVFLFIAMPWAHYFQPIVDRSHAGGHFIQSGSELIWGWAAVFTQFYLSCIPASGL